MATYTFLFTDIEGSTRLWAAKPEGMGAALAEHDRALITAITDRGGSVFKHVGDGLLAVFSSAGNAVAAAADAQRAISELSHPDVGGFAVRMAISTGDASLRDGDYFGLALSSAARILEVAHGGQILVDLVTEHLAAPALDDVGFVDLGEHRLRDLSHPVHIFQLAAPGLPLDFPALATVDKVLNNLPIMATSFVGRDEELAEVEKLVRGSRMVTITGVGGSGKTRLALQVAASTVGGFPDGVWYVDLAGITDPALVVPATAAALGVMEQPRRSLTDSIIDQVGNHQVLLVIDNCEHLIAASADLVTTLLTGAPAVHIVTTSRELLGIGGEVAYGVGPLGLPDDVRRLSLRDISHYDSVRLFVERAIAARPDFHLTAENAPSIITICRRLDGMPLALELAAACIRSFSIQQIADNLDRRFRLLTGGSRTALPRQQTLAATIDWSYRLLTPTEQALFERLSVFQGRFTLDAATRICTDEAVDGLDMLQLVPSLVDKSLLTADTRRSETRYRLLETVRQFSRELLDEEQGADEFRLRHARYFAEVAEPLERRGSDREKRRWRDRIEADLDNFRQAMLSSVESDHPEYGLRIAVGLYGFWFFSVHYGEGIRWLDATLEAAAGSGPKELEARAHGLLGNLAAWKDLTEMARDHALAALETYRQLDQEGDRSEAVQKGLISALVSASNHFKSDPERCIAMNQDALDIARRSDELSLAVVAQGNIAEGYALLGDIERARSSFEAAIATAKETGSVYLVAQTAAQLGQSEMGVGDPERAEKAHRLSLGYAELADVPELAAFQRSQILMARHDAGWPGMHAEFAAQLEDVLQNEEHRDGHLFLPGWLIQRADLDLSAGDAETAAALIGASDALVEVGKYRDWSLEPRRQRVLAGVRSRLDPAAVESAMAEGAGLSIEDLYALVTAGASQAD